MGARTIHPFPARMAPDIAIDQLHSSRHSEQLVVLDPMCGSGTVLSAATTHGHVATGFDVDPLAALMSRVATRPLDTSALSEAADAVVRDARSSNNDRAPWPDQETQKFAEYWFAHDQRVQLHRLTCLINEHHDVAIRQALQVAVSRIIVTKAPKASLAADTSHSRPHKVATASAYDVFDGFKSSVASLARLLEQRSIVGSSVVAMGDARFLPIREESVDLVITSPPYLNAIDYLRGHKLSLIWFGYSIPQLRKIRSDSIGSERALTEPLSERIEAMVASVAESAPNPELLPTPTIARYARDLCLFSDQMYKACRPGARVVTVIGNSTLRGNYIQNDALVRRAYADAGFSGIQKTERELPENKRYLPVSSSGAGTAMAKRMRTEVVVTARRL